jgi:hypothetical protein
MEIRMENVERGVIEIKALAVRVLMLVAVIVGAIETLSTVLQSILRVSGVK